eukprot:g3524.t1
MVLFAGICNLPMLNNSDIPFLTAKQKKKLQKRKKREQQRQEKNEHTTKNGNRDNDENNRNVKVEENQQMTRAVSGIRKHYNRIAMRIFKLHKEWLQTEERAQSFLIAGINCASRVPCIIETFSEEGRKVAASLHAFEGLRDRLLFKHRVELEKTAKGLIKLSSQLLEIVTDMEIEIDSTVAGTANSRAVAAELSFQEQSRRTLTYPVSIADYKEWLGDIVTMHRSESFRKKHVLDKFLAKGLQGLDKSDLFANREIETNEKKENETGLTALEQILSLWSCTSEVTALDLTFVAEVEQKITMQ